VSIGELIGQFKDDPGGVLSFTEPGLYHWAAGHAWPSHGFFNQIPNDTQSKDIFCQFISIAHTPHRELIKQAQESIQKYPPPASWSPSGPNVSGHPFLDTRTFDGGDGGNWGDFRGWYTVAGGYARFKFENAISANQNNILGGGYENKFIHLFNVIQNRGPSIFGNYTDASHPLILRNTYTSQTYLDVNEEPIAPPMFNCDMLNALNDQERKYVFDEAPFSKTNPIIYKSKESALSKKDQDRIFPPQGYNNNNRSGMTGSEENVNFLESLYSKKIIIIRKKDIGLWSTWLRYVAKRLTNYVNDDKYLGGFIGGWISKGQILDGVTRRLKLSNMDNAISFLTANGFKAGGTTLLLINQKLSVSTSPSVKSAFQELVNYFNSGEFYSKDNPKVIQLGDGAYSASQCDDKVGFVSAYYYNSTPSVGAYSYGWFCHRIDPVTGCYFVGPCGLGLPNSPSNTSILNSSYTRKNYCTEIGMKEGGEPLLTYTYTYEPKLFDNVIENGISKENSQTSSNSSSEGDITSICKPWGDYAPHVRKEKFNHNSASVSKLTFSGFSKTEYNHFLDYCLWDDNPSPELIEYDPLYNNDVIKHKTFAIGTYIPKEESSSGIKNIISQIFGPPDSCTQSIERKNSVSGNATRTIDTKWNFQYKTGPNPGTTYLISKDETTGKITSNSNSLDQKSGSCTGEESTSGATEGGALVNPEFNCQECEFDHNETGFNLKLFKGPEYEQDEDSGGPLSHLDCGSSQGEGKNKNSLSDIQDPELTWTRKYSNENKAEKHRDILLRYLSSENAPEAKYFKIYNSFSVNFLNSKVLQLKDEYSNIEGPSQSLDGFIYEKLNEEGYRVGAHAMSYSFFTDWKLSYYYGATKITACRGYVAVNKPEKISYLKLTYSGTERGVKGDYFFEEEKKLSFRYNSIICKASEPVVTEETFTIPTGKIFSEAHIFESTDNSSILTTLVKINWTMKEKKLIEKFCGNRKDKRTGYFLKDIYLSKGYRINEGDEESYNPTED
jgi:hypothetical protein